MDINEIDKNLQNEFKMRKIAIENIAFRNKLKANKSSKYRKLESLEKEIIFRIGKLSFEDKNSKDIKDLQNQLEIIKKEKKIILEKIGLSFEDLKPKYKCKKCKDVGFIRGLMCECYKKERNYSIIKQCGIDKNELVSFDDINENLITNEKQLKDFKRLKGMLEKWCNDFPNVNKNNIFLSGATGLGKTYLTKCMAKKLIEEQAVICYVSAFEMNNLFLKYHSTFDYRKDHALIPLLESDVLFIDDLGSEPILKNVTENYLYVILSERERFKRPTIITSNVSIDTMVSRYGERIYSRLVNKKEAYLINIQGDDLRMAIKSVK